MEPSNSEARGPKTLYQTIKVSLTWVELAVALVFLIVGYFYLMDALALPKPMNSRSIGAGYFPTMVALGALLTTSLLIFFSLLKKLKKIDVMPVTIKRPLWVVFTIVIMIGHALLLEALGTLISSALAAFLVMVACGERRLRYLITIPLGLTLGIYVLFNLALGIQFP